MVMQRRSVVRTPRRRKIWAQYNDTIVLGAGTSTPKSRDMLDDFSTDMGVNFQSGLTVMRMVGQSRLIKWIGSETTPEYGNLLCGITWMDPNITAGSDGDGNIPLPLQAGVREHSWIQQWQIGAFEAPSPGADSVGAPLEPGVEGLSFWNHDITQQRKQPTAASRLTFIVSGGTGFETNTVALDVKLSILIALP